MFSNMKVSFSNVPKTTQNSIRMDLLKACNGTYRTPHDGEFLNKPTIAAAQQSAAKRHLKLVVEPEGTGYSVTGAYRKLRVKFIGAVKQVRTGGDLIDVATIDPRSYWDVEVHGDYTASAAVIGLAELFDQGIKFRVSGRMKAKLRKVIHRTGSSLRRFYPFVV